MVIKITPEQYNHFMTNFNPQSGFRVGQAFLNKYMKNTIDPELFYESCDDKAWTMIVDRYVEW